MNYIKEISYGTFAGGVQNGFVGFEIVFEDTAPVQRDAETVADLIALLVRHPGAAGRGNRISLSGQFPLSNFQFMYDLTDSLREVGFILFINLNGEIFYPWIRKDVFEWINVHLDKPHWAPHMFHSLVVDLNSVKQPEPLMPNTYNGNQPLYLNHSKDIPTAELFSYLQKAKYKWNIYTETKRIKEFLFRKEDKYE